jgi:hypothetical protein
LNLARTHRWLRWWWWVLVVVRLGKLVFWSSFHKILSFFAVLEQLFLEKS